MILKNNFSFKNLPSPPPLKDMSISINSKIGRVKDIILDENHPLFSQYGGWDGMGLILFENIEKGATTNILFAKPLYPQNKNYPLLNELVLLFLLPNQGIGESYGSKSWYYLSNINLWNTPHHNVYPDLNKVNISSTTQDISYQEVEAGLSKSNTNPQPQEDIFNSPNNPSQNTFIERDDIYPLLYFSGDSIYEGRWGNSIRLGSTSKSKSQFKNIWSEGTSKNGDPIVIIRNGQPSKVNQKSWEPIVEDLNKDMSSLWMTSTQKVPFNSNVDNLFKPFSPQPLTPSTYNNPQIIGTSDRILLYAKKDDILLGAERSIDLSTNGTFKVNSSNFYVDNNKVRLGDKNATESLILGDSFLNEFKILLDSLNQLCSALTKDSIWPGGVPAPNVEVNITAANLLLISTSLKAKLSTFKSRVSKTI